MRLLYISICSQTVNPTHSLVPVLLQLSADVACFGPGFVDESTLNRGIAAFVGGKDQFDFYVINLLGADPQQQDMEYFYRFTCPPYPIGLLKNFVVDALGFLNKSDVPKIYVLIGQDSYALSARKAQWIADTNAYFIAWAGGFSRPLDQLAVLTSEEFYKKKSSDKFAKKANEPTVFGRWHDVVSKYEHKFINLGHFIAETEFNWTALDGRRDKVMVPGQMYVRREAARRKLAEHRMLTRSGYFKLLMSILDHLRLRPYTRPLLQLLYNRIFVNGIASMRYAYTDGYGYDRPARKFFEIPALGTVLLCTPCAGFADLGFVDREHAVIVAPESILEAVHWLQQDAARAQQIADAGRRLMWEKHSLHARAEQLARCLNSIVSGRYAGSRWQNGEFVVAERSGAAVSTASHL